MAERLEFEVLTPRQGDAMPVCVFVATAEQIARIARITRAARDKKGTLDGFQRPQIAAHIREIHDYLADGKAILPNAIVLGFESGAKIRRNRKGNTVLSIDVSKGPPGLVVDGQQRFTALKQLRRGVFEVPVTAFICDGEQELRRQFILVNNTKPLPKALIYELLPTAGELPPRMSSRSQAALLTEALNFTDGSSLKGMIKQQTNPRGVIRDTVLQKVLMNSLSDGALRLYADDHNLLLTRGYELISEFFHAVAHVFPRAWADQTPATSRLLHGTGIVAMGFVMETIHSLTGASKRDAFANGLRPLVGKAAWTSGSWKFGDEVRPWNSLQNVSVDTRHLADLLVQTVRRGLVRTRVAAA